MSETPDTDAALDKCFAHPVTVEEANFIEFARHLEKQRDALALTRPYDCYWSRRALAAEKLLKRQFEDMDGRLRDGLLRYIPHGTLERQAIYDFVLHPTKPNPLVIPASVPADKCACCRRTDLPLTKIHLIELTLCRPCIDAIDARIKEINHD